MLNLIPFQEKMAAEAGIAPTLEVSETSVLLLNYSAII
jgi:hypothetical protein